MQEIRCLPTERCGSLSVIVYVLLGAVGIPVFSNFTSGIGILLGNTGGYIVGFIFMGLIYWMITHFLGNMLKIEILAVVIGLAVCYMPFSKHLEIAETTCYNKLSDLLKMFILTVGVL